MSFSTQFKSLIPKDVTHITVTGLAYGDEGKGKTALALQGWYDIAAASNGGANAGHNVMINGEKYHFHELPGSAVGASDIYLSQGRVTYIPGLLEEFKLLQSSNPDAKLILAEGAHVIFEHFQRQLDGDIEGYRSKIGTAVGTTKKGIGPAYAAKALRVGQTIGSLYCCNDQELQDHVHLVSNIYPSINSELYLQECRITKTLLHQYLDDGIVIIDRYNNFIPQAIKNTKKVMIECSQSVRLSLSSGSYPNCTSSECGFNGVGPNLNIERAGYKIGVIKAITSKVGGGRFPTKWDGQIVSTEFEDLYRQTAGEFGATTGRPRDVGYLDIVQLRHVFNTGNRPDVLWINMGDMLALLAEHQIPHRVATAYKFQHPVTKELITTTDTIPPEYATIEEVVYEDIGDITSANYGDYISSIRKYLGFTGPIVLGTGPGTEDNILFAA